MSILDIAFYQHVQAGNPVQVLDHPSRISNWQNLYVRAGGFAPLNYLTPLKVASGKDKIDLSIPLFCHGESLTFDRDRALWVMIAQAFPRMDSIYITVPITDPRKSIYMVELVHHFDKGLYVYPEDIQR